MAPTTAPAMAPLLRPEFWVVESVFESLDGVVDPDEFVELSCTNWAFPSCDQIFGEVDGVSEM